MYVCSVAIGGQASSGQAAGHVCAPSQSAHSPALHVSSSHIQHGQEESLDVKQVYFYIRISFKCEYC